MKAFAESSFYLDPENIRVHYEDGSKRFEGQRAWRDAANLEQRSDAPAILNCFRRRGERREIGQLAKASFSV
jgi:hypothetical protein